MSRTLIAAMRRAARTTRKLNAMSPSRLIQKSLATAMVSQFAGRMLKSLKAVTSPNGEKPLSKKSANSSDKAKRDAKSDNQEIKNPSAVTTISRTRPRRPLGEVLETLRQSGVNPAGAFSFPSFKPGNKVPAITVPQGAEFSQRSFTCKAGTRSYKLYIPALSGQRPNGLILMLHGCTQNPDDFAIGTNMNVLAEQFGLLIAYPQQTSAKNASACWNWFEERHQMRGSGEPAILAGLTSSLIKEFGIEKTKVFAAGLSAGGAMAVVLSKTYSDIFTAIGVHSGLAYQSAGNAMSALAVMRGKGLSSQFVKEQPLQESVKSKVAAKLQETVTPVRTIIFQGTADRIVHPSNAQDIFEAAMASSDAKASLTHSGSINSRDFMRTIMSQANGVPLVESWLIKGAGHAWSGGNAAGTYVDNKGPDASAEMVRFFLMLPKKK